jgi:hypothetical protein
MVIEAEHHSVTPHISTAARGPIGLKPMQSTKMLVLKSSDGAACQRSCGRRCRKDLRAEAQTAGCAIVM